MSQVLFRYLRINRQMVLLFKDSKAGPRNMEVADFNKISKARTSEKTNHYAHRPRGFAPSTKFNKIRSRHQRGR
jgi:hypothetical protein